MNTSIRHITRKKDKQFLFEVKLNWLAGSKGILSVNDVNIPVPVTASPEFGGEEKTWTPEHLFLSSISSCYMITFLAFARKLGLKISNFHCNTIGKIEIIEGKYKFTNINLFPKVYIAGEELREKAGIAMEKTHRHCLITNSVNADVFYHSEILIDAYPVHKIKKGVRNSMLSK